MKPDQINKAIAELCGWTDIEKIEIKNVKREGDDHFIGWSSPTKGWCPKYCNDLNAMHDAEKTLKGNDWIKYIGALRKFTEEHFGISHATAAQRAEAFLRTLGKWEEGE